MLSLNKMLCFLITTLLFILNTSSHPSSSMIYYEGNLYWVYISPINDVNHKAAIMKWNEKEGVSTFCVSEYSGSDFSLSKNNENGFYVLESHFTGNEYSVRLLHFNNESEFREVIPWFTSAYRIDQNGFFVDDAERIVFCRYPQVYVRESDGTLSDWYNFVYDVHFITAEENNQYLIRGESIVELVDGTGNVIRDWESLLKDDINNLPFRGNIIYDVDYADDKILIAYWGNRSFELIESEQRITIKRLMHPYIPHAALINGEDYYLLASTIAPGEYNEINPALWRINNGKAELIWGDYKKVIHTRQVAK